MLLIEAGNDDRQNSEVYDIYDFGQAYNTALDWAWPTEQGKTIHGWVLFTLDASDGVHTDPVEQGEDFGRQLVYQCSAVYAWFGSAV